jgi:hypothetical protein
LKKNVNFLHDFLGEKNCFFQKKAPLEVLFLLEFFEFFHFSTNPNKNAQDQRNSQEMDSYHRISAPSNGGLAAGILLFTVIVCIKE